MNDRELLEFAAKAAGIKFLRDPFGTYHNCTGYHPASNIFATPEWNPLTDDGDALRLAVKLEIDVNHGDILVVAEKVRPIEYGVAEQNGTDPYAATRRAIVKVAAEIGKGMK